METSSHLLLLFFFFFFPLAAFSGETCSPITCGLIGPPIRFPFWVPGRYTCGYKGFDLSCHHRRPILTLPDAGDFLVSRIDYQNQVLFINDPDFCLPKRLLNFSLAGSVFQKGPNWANVTFLNCSSEFPMEQFVPVLCLSGNHNYTTVVSTDGTHVPPSCRILGTVSAPTYDQYTFNMDLLESLPLTWKFPNCRSCEAGGGTCGLKSGKVYQGVLNMASSLVSASLVLYASWDSYAVLAIGSRPMAIVAAAATTTTTTRNSLCRQSFHNQGAPSRLASTHPP
ncbi:putative RING-H2 finger protein ATL21B isoform X2 [Diospyros lotus]|uniref:putative RING-H2 finger protein ATL21B isoform X2 n=1 Tax=Diospyros lotus TaxID=55363 RepID=UPI002252906A|nr:putative RING-H2 finger protein ATL21B isoform X2 [Diospyros lotus]